MRRAVLAVKQALARGRREEVQPRRVYRQAHRLPDPSLGSCVDAGGEEGAVTVCREEGAFVFPLVGDRVLDDERLRIYLEEDEDVRAELLEHLDADVDLREPGVGELGVLEGFGPDADDRVAVAREPRAPLPVERDRVATQADRVNRLGQFYINH